MEISLSFVPGLPEVECMILDTKVPFLIPFFVKKMNYKLIEGNKFTLQTE